MSETDRAENGVHGESVFFFIFQYHPRQSVLLRAGAVDARREGRMNKTTTTTTTIVNNIYHHTVNNEH